METGMSINCATVLLDLFVQNNVLHNITIHCDVGENGKTRELIKGIIGYVTSAGLLTPLCRCGVNGSTRPSQTGQRLVCKTSTCGFESHQSLQVNNKGLWCNGNTLEFDSRIEGSSPSGPASG